MRSIVAINAVRASKVRALLVHEESITDTFCSDPVTMHCLASAPKQVVGIRGSSVAQRRMSGVQGVLVVEALAEQLEHGRGAIWHLTGACDPRRSALAGARI